jgi:hypothetical protein
MRKRILMRLLPALLVIAMAVGYICVIYLPGRQADQIVAGLSAATEKDRIHAMEVLEKTHYLGLGKRRVADKLRAMLRETKDAELRPLIVTVANCGDFGTGVNLLRDAADQQLVLAAVGRHREYAAKNGYNFFSATIAPNGKCYIGPSGLKAVDALYFDADGKPHSYDPVNEKPPEVR